MRNLLFFGALAVVTSGANAAFVVDTEPAMLPDVENVLFNDPTLLSQGTLVQGMTNDTALIVNWFDAGEDLVTGRARISPLDGAMTQFSVAMDDPTLGIAAYQFNIDAMAAGEATIGIYQGGTLTVAEKVTLGEHGPNFFRVYGTEKEVMSMITITSDVDIASIGRNRILGVPAPVPEPSAFVALGIGVALLALRKRR